MFFIFLLELWVDKSVLLIHDIQDVTLEGLVGR